MYIRFLIPINFEPYTINAINYCILLAQKFQSEITLLHAYTPYLEEDQSDEDSSYPKITSHQDAIYELDKIKQLTIKEANPNNINIKTEIIEGYPEDIIPIYCNNYHPDLVIMGTKSKGETIKELLGSVTLDIINNIHFPVLAVPKDYDLNLNKLQNILFLTDFWQCEYTSLHKLIRLIMSFDTMIHSVHYCAGGKEKANIDQLNVYDEYCASTYRNQKMQSEYIYGDDIMHAANEYIANTDIDLLAITRKKRNIIEKILHPSLTKTMLFNVDIPMLFFHQ